MIGVQRSMGAALADQMYPRELLLDGLRHFDGVGAGLS